MNRLPYRFRMADPYVARLERIRPPFVRLADVLRIAHVRARLAGVRRGHNRPRARFHPLTAEVLEARRCGVDPRFLRGAR